MIFLILFITNQTPLQRHFSVTETKNIRSNKNPFGHYQTIFSTSCLGTAVVGDRANMSSFTDSNFVKKLSELNNTQQSIQTLSLWLIHHRKHSKTITQVWLRELQKGN
jgi:hypothetical protein